MDYKPVDVFAYAMIGFYIFDGSKPWRDIVSSSEIENRVIKGDRPNFSKKKISDFDRNLLTKCWDQDPKKRPGFQDIVLLLQNGVNK